MKKIKTALFSATSGHAVYYAGSLPHHEKYEWVAACVLPKDRGNRAFQAIPPDVKIYESERQLLEDFPDLDAVILAGSNDLTYGQFKLCAEYGIKNLIMMKVPSLCMEEYEEMQRIAKEKDITVQIELEMRVDQTVRRIKDLCNSGAVGNIQSIYITNTTVVVPPEIRPWITDPKQSYGRVHELKANDGRFRGGALTDHPHAFDLARFFADSEFESIYADVSENFRDGRIVEEGVFVVGKMKNGISVSIDPSYSRHENKLPPVTAATGWEGYPKRVEVNVIINGDKGSIIGDCFHSGVYHTGLPYNTFAVKYLVGHGHYQSMLDTFADAVENHKTPDVNLDSHENNMRLINACYDSIYTGKRIML